MPAYFSVGIAFPFLTAFGYVCIMCVREPRLGWPAAVAMHGGLDFAAAYWCLDLRYGWTTPLYARACGLALEAAVHRSWLAPLDVCASALAEL